VNKALFIFASRAQEMSPEEIIKNIPPETLRDIKSRDERPFFQAFVTAHEGTGTPTVEGETPTPVTWVRSAIQSMKNVVTRGIKGFAGHGKGNREPIGEMVGQLEKEIDGKLSHISIYYHPPDKVEEAKTYDCCSNEGIWELTKGVGEWIATRLDKLAGVAFLRRDETPPALNGANKLGMVYAAAAGNTPPDQPPGKGIGERMTFQELKQEIKNMNIHPSQVYTLGEIQEDRAFSGAFDEIKMLKESNQLLEANIQTLTNEKSTLEKEQRKAGIQPRFNETIKTLPKNVKIYIERQFGKADFNEYSDEELKGFIDTQTAEYQELVKSGAFRETPEQPGIEIQKFPEHKAESPRFSMDPKDNPILKNEYLGANNGN